MSGVPDDERLSNYMPRTRAGHWKKDSCDVYVGRGSVWGNPYVRTREQARKSRHDVEVVDDPIGAYERYVRRRPDLMQALPELRGKALGCFCIRLDDEPRLEVCHAQVLARMAEEGRTRVLWELGRTWWVYEDRDNLRSYIAALRVLRREREICDHCNCRGGHAFDCPGVHADAL